VQSHRAKKRQYGTNAGERSGGETLLGLLHSFKCGEYLRKMGDRENVLDILPDLGDHDIAADLAERDHGADEAAEAGAIDVVDLPKVEDDMDDPVLYQLVDLLPEREGVLLPQRITFQA